GVEIVGHDVVDARSLADVHFAPHDGAAVSDDDALADHEPVATLLLDAAVAAADASEAAEGELAISEQGEVVESLRAGGNDGDEQHRGDEDSARERRAMRRGATRGDQTRVGHCRLTGSWVVSDPGRRCPRMGRLEGFSEPVRNRP